VEINFLYEIMVMKLRCFCFEMFELDINDMMVVMFESLME